MNDTLTDLQLERYQRQILLPEIGGKGQQRLDRSTVGIVGAGGLGSPAALYLAGAGIGKLILIDNDTVALDNLHRQILYSTDNLSTPKVEAAKGEIARRNPEVIVETHQSLLNRNNARNLLKECHIVLDATDNFPVRLVIADTCHELKVPYIHAGVQRFHGQAITVIPGETTCYRCIFPHAPPAKAVPSCAETGILGPVAGFFSTVQATEALKYLTGTSGLLTDRLLTADLLNWKVRIIPKKRQPHCPLCGTP